MSAHCRCGRLGTVSFGRGAALAVFGFRTLLGHFRRRADAHGPSAVRFEQMAEEALRRAAVPVDLPLAFVVPDDHVGEPYKSIE